MGHNRTPFVLYTASHCHGFRIERSRSRDITCCIGPLTRWYSDRGYNGAFRAATASEQRSRYGKCD